jgi:hypothetical protein
LNTSALSLDHVGAITRDLSAAGARWERLGFKLSPLSRQSGAVPGRTGMQPWASANRCAIFRKGYLELIGIFDSSAYNPWQRFLARFEGLHLLALRCADADASFERLRLTASFLDPPIARERQLMHHGEQRTMHFRNIFSRDTECPEGRYIVIEHQTPELLWQEELLEHENGALGLADVVIVADDSGVADRARALDSIPQVLTPAAFFARFGWTPPAPCFAAISIVFADLRRALALLLSRGITPMRNGNDLWLAPEAANGFVMRLIEQA